VQVSEFSFSFLAGINDPSGNPNRIQADRKHKWYLRPLRMLRQMVFALSCKELQLFDACNFSIYSFVLAMSSAAAIDIKP
jgi:hypothetical protein